MPRVATCLASYYYLEKKDAIKRESGRDAYVTAGRILNEKGRSNRAALIGRPDSAKPWGERRPILVP